MWKIWKKKLCRLHGVSYKLQYYLNAGAAKNLYFSFIYFSLVYCICIWGGILQCTQRGRLLVKYHEKIVLHIFNRSIPEIICIIKIYKYIILLDLHKFSVSIYTHKMLKIHTCDQGYKLLMDMATLVFSSISYDPLFQPPCGAPVGSIRV